MEVLERDAWDPPLADATRTITNRDLIWWYRNQASQSRLKLITQRIYKSLCDDRVFPNTFKSAAVARELKDGRTMLFMPSNERREPPRTLTPHVAAIGRLRDALREDGHRFGIYLLPDKLAVYRDLLKIPVPHGDEGAQLLTEFERELRGLGIAVLNLEPVLHRAAGEAFRSGELIYWTDDTHWNPRGIDVAARELGQAFDLCGRPGEPVVRQAPGRISSTGMNGRNEGTSGSDQR
jgi:hypothetical protein